MAFLVQYLTELFRCGQNTTNFAAFSLAVTLSHDLRMTACQWFSAHAHYYPTLIFAADPLGSISFPVKSRWRFANHATKRNGCSGDENAWSYAANNTLFMRSCVQFCKKKDYLKKHSISFQDSSNSSSLKCLLDPEEVCLSCQKVS